MKLHEIPESTRLARVPLMRLVCTKCGERYTRLSESQITCPRCGNVVDLDTLTKHGLALEFELQPEPTVTPVQPIQTVKPKAVVTPKEKMTPVPANVIDEALQGSKPKLDHEITMEELGERLGKFRRGRYPGQAFTKQAISLYRSKPEQQSNDFIEAFFAWRAAEITRQDQLRARFNLGHINEMLHDQGYIEQLGQDPVKALVLVGQLPPYSLIHVNGTASVIEFTGVIERCACGTLFAKRSWNQKRCSVCRGGKH